MCKVVISPCPDCPEPTHRESACLFRPCENLLKSHIRALQERISSYKSLPQDQKSPKEEKKNLLWWGAKSQPNCKVLKFCKGKLEIRCVEHSTARRPAKKGMRNAARGHELLALSNPKEFPTWKSTKGSNSTNQGTKQVGEAANPIPGRRL